MERILTLQIISRCCNEEIVIILTAYSLVHLQTMNQLQQLWQFQIMLLTFQSR
ncbi:unnamed protein product [Paramecium octaurelia]|uniref:Uncharacterized protein n=1 Tax=Paramecium octaurelia TaxID=43137 RepID=A0A8S1SKP4_PAROT|nr:unnamed protein product [Paramecium octaurelia]